MKIEYNIEIFLINKAVIYYDLFFLELIEYVYTLMMVMVT